MRTIGKQDHIEIKSDGTGTMGLMKRVMRRKRLLLGTTMTVIESTGTRKMTRTTAIDGIDDDTIIDDTGGTKMMMMTSPTTMKFLLESQSQRRWTIDDLARTSL